MKTFEEKDGLLIVKMKRALLRGETVAYVGKEMWDDFAHFITANNLEVVHYRQDNDYPHFDAPIVSLTVKLNHRKLNDGDRILTTPRLWFEFCDSENQQLYNGRQMMAGIYDMEEE